MPRLVNRPPAYSLHKPSGQAKVKYNGKVKYLGRYGTPESHQRYAEFIASIPKPDEKPALAEPAPGAVLLVGECVLRYFEHAKRYYARDGVPTGEHVTIRASLRPLEKMFADIPAKELGPKRLKEVQKAMVRLDWSRRYVNKATSIVKRCFTWCASEELVPADIAMALKTVQGLKKGRTAAREKAPVGPVADEHVEAILPHVSDLVADVVRVMRLTGMRPGEIATMTAAAIDRTDPTCWVYRPGHHKTAHHDKSRVIFIGPKAQELILPSILKAGNDGRLFPITRSSLRTSVARGCRRAFPHPTLKDIPIAELTTAQRSELKAWFRAHTWHPNRLRHSCGTEVRAQFGLEAAQVVLGHSRADVTQTYAERDMARAREVARKIG